MSIRVLSVFSVLLSVSLNTPHIENVIFIPFDSCFRMTSFGFCDLMSLKLLSNSSKYDSVINRNMTVKTAKSSPMFMSSPRRYLRVKNIFAKS